MSKEVAINKQETDNCSRSLKSGTMKNQKLEKDVKSFRVQIEQLPKFTETKTVN